MSKVLYLTRSVIKEGKMLPKKKIFAFKVIFLFFLVSLSVLLFPSENNKIPIIHVKGTHYQVGFQIGTHMKSQLVELIQKSREYVEKETDMDWNDIRA